MSEHRVAFFFAGFPYVVNSCSKKCVDFCDCAQKITQRMSQKVKCQVQWVYGEVFHTEPPIPLVLNAAFFLQQKISQFSQQEITQLTSQCDFLT